MNESVWKGTRNLPYSREILYTSFAEADMHKLAEIGLY